ncbi:MAG: HepT-like ribonuclease domain-containing protein [Aquificaceae bacterium]|uniref:HepT-like ribonuclease domain-containing protein n=1 Tax=Hydrogenobacter sp. Uz 6-8 TaxID=3384828 RepID=UPI00309BFE8B
MREIRDYLMDIKDECEYLMSRTRGLNYNEFISSEELKRAFVRSLEIIGEASKHIPKEIRKK